jgi:MATE family multidrug resistance protein
MKKEEMVSFLELGLPSVLMTCSEWWSFEVLALFTGYIGVNEQAAYTVLIFNISFFIIIGRGLKNAAISLIGIYIGKNETHKAKTQFFYIINTTLVMICIANFLQ